MIWVGKSPVANVISGPVLNLGHFALKAYTPGALGPKIKVQATWVCLLGISNMMKLFAV